MLTHQDQNSALLIASENGHLSTVNLLLQRGSVIDHQNQVTLAQCKDTLHEYVVLAQVNHQLQQP